MNICTLSDKNFLLKGLALYQSLTNTGTKFTLHYLCLDSITFDKLRKLNYSNIILYKLSELEKDKELAEARFNPPSNYAENQREQFIWSLTPYFTNYILNRIPENEYLIYIDADICFYQSPLIILNIIKDKSVGIHSHRFSGEYTEKHTNGWFNVGVVIFKNNKIGRHISNQWKNWLLKTSHKYYKFYGTCGDQKYLELFIKLWNKEHICIFDKKISHLATWYCERLQHPKQHHIIYNGEVQPVIFFHLSDFKFDLITNEHTKSKDKSINDYYNEYFNLIIKVNENISR